MPNIPEHPDLDFETPAEIGFTANLMSLQVTSDISIPELSKHFDSEDLLEDRPRVCMLDIVVLPNLAGDAPDSPSVTSCKTELPGLNTAENTDVTAVECRRPVPRRSFWSRTKKFVR